MAWVDFRKPFDVVPHELINRLLKAIRAPKCVRKTVRCLIPLWITAIVFKRGLFQGDCHFTAVLPMHCTAVLGFNSLGLIIVLESLMFFSKLITLVCSI